MPQTMNPALDALRLRYEQTRQSPVADTTVDAPALEYGLTKALSGRPSYQRKTFSPELDAFEPSEAELRIMQSQPATGGMSRDMLRDFLMGKTRAGLESGRIEHEQQLQRAVEPQRVAGEFDIQEQGLANEGAIAQTREAGQQAGYNQQAAGRVTQDVERMRQRGETDRLAQLLKVQQAYPNRSLSVSNIGSIGPAPRDTSATGTPTQLLRDVMNARQALALAKTGSSFLNSNITAISQAQAALDQALASAVTRFPASPNVKGFAQDVIQRPEVLELTDLASIYDAMGVDVTQILPEEHEELQQLLNVLRGKL